MDRLTRRSVLRASAGLAAAGAIARPFIANAEAKTATVWWVQGFAQEEDIAFKAMIADYEKASGNTIDYTIAPYAPMRQKIVSAMTSGVVRSVPKQPGRNSRPLCLGRPFLPFGFTTRPTPRFRTNICGGPGPTS